MGFSKRRGGGEETKGREEGRGEEEEGREGGGRRVRAGVMMTHHESYETL